MIAVGSGGGELAIDDPSSYGLPSFVRAPRSSSMDEDHHDHFRRNDNTSNSIPKKNSKNVAVGNNRSLTNLSFLAHQHSVLNQTYRRRYSLDNSSCKNAIITLKELVLLWRKRTGSFNHQSRHHRFNKSSGSTFDSVNADDNCYYLDSFIPQRNQLRRYNPAPKSKSNDELSSKASHGIEKKSHATTGSYNNSSNNTSSSSSLNHNSRTDLDMVIRFDCDDCNNSKATITSSVITPFEPNATAAVPFSLKRSKSTPLLLPSIQRTKEMLLFDRSLHQLTDQKQLKESSTTATSDDTFLTNDDYNCVVNDGIENNTDDDDDDDSFCEANVQENANKMYIVQDLGASYFFNEEEFYNHHVKPHVKMNIDNEDDHNSLDDDIEEQVLIETILQPASSIGRQSEPSVIQIPNLILKKQSGKNTNKRSNSLDSISDDDDFNEDDDSFGEANDVETPDMTYLEKELGSSCFFECPTLSRAEINMTGGNDVTSSNGTSLPPSATTGTATTSNYLAGKVRKGPQFMTIGEDEEEEDDDEDDDF